MRVKAGSGVRAVLLHRASSSSPGYPTPQPSNLFDIVYSVWFLLEQVLVEVAAEGGRGEDLVAVGTSLVFDGGRFAAGVRSLVVMAMVILLTMILLVFTVVFGGRIGFFAVFSLRGRGGLVHG